MCTLQGLWPIDTWCTSGPQEVRGLRPEYTSESGVASGICRKSRDVRCTLMETFTWAALWMFDWGYIDWLIVRYLISSSSHFFILLLYSKWVLPAGDLMAFILIWSDVVCSGVGSLCAKSCPDDTLCRSCNGEAKIKFTAIEMKISLSHSDLFSFASKFLCKN